MRSLYYILFFTFLTSNVFSQISYSRTGHVHVSSQNNIKTIEADNYQIITTLNFENGEINFEGLLKSFEFKLGALDRVFNSERINVNQYPKIKFEGKILGHKNLNLVNNKEVEVQVKGILYIWDEKRVTRAKGTLKKLPNGEIHAISDFSIKIEEASMHKLNDLIDQKLPDILNISTESFGVSRDIDISLDVNYIPRNW